MKEPYTIRISSQKGGVGKTTIAVNLAIALALEDFKVILIDGDMISPSVGFLLGMHEVSIGIREVMENKVSPQRAIVRHESGFDVLPGTQKLKQLPSQKDMAMALRKAKDVAKKEKYDFMIADTAPGYWFPELARLYDEALIVSTMSMPSLTSAIRFGELYFKERVKHNFALNRVTNKRYDVSVKEAEDVLGQRVIAAFPEDPAVPRAESVHIPVYVYKRSSPFAVEARTLARYYAVKRGGGIRGSQLEVRSVNPFVRFFRRLFGVH